ncbi:uncharacterized protein V1516DRAFT_633400 [Lipomyces oligophaga]|uniref:uncharacterized protein n=1 Tax=Lipomyces oligophaga TaxID=45792 RepID=UPI0034CDDB42
MSSPNPDTPLSRPQHKRTDSLDLLSPTQSFVGSIDNISSLDAAAVSSDDEAPDPHKRTSHPPPTVPRQNTLSRISQSYRFGNNLVTNRSEYRFLHASHDDEYYDHPDHTHDSLSVTSEDELAHMAMSNRRRYVYATIALVIVLVSFVVNTEAMTYVAQDLHYQKPIFVLYITHSSWMLLWPLQVGVLWLISPRHSLRDVVHKHNSITASTMQLIADHNHSKASAVTYMFTCSGILCILMALAASTWYIAVNLTTPGDVTAIYNCSAFFAYAFSIPLLHERFSWTKVLSVFLALCGVMIVAYGDRVVYRHRDAPPVGATANENDIDSSNRFFGNIIIGFGAVLYGLYEVVYKRYLCPENSLSPRRSTIFANVVGATIGLLSFLMLWVILPVLHYFDLEKFELPDSTAAFYISISVTANMIFSGSFLILMSLTSPILSSVASLLTIFLVAVTDWFLFSTPLSLGSVIGGAVVMIAFALLAFACWKEFHEADEEALEGDPTFVAVSQPRSQWQPRRSIIESA